MDIYVKIAAGIIAVITIGMSLIQLLLVIKMPLGEYAWGGQHQVLPKKLRVGSFISIFILLFMGIIFLEKAELIVLGLKIELVNTLSWIFAFFLVLNMLGNLVSKSEKERCVMTPITLIAALSALGVCIYS